MADYDDLYGGRFLAATDLKAPVTATIERVDLETFNRPGEPARTKAVAYFKNAKKPMVVNKTNAGVLAAAFGKAFSGWVGQRVTVKAEPTTFGGKNTLGLRLYPANAPKQIEAPSLRDEMSDAIPW
jgi:hypothetical protein